ncbi:type II secretion system F family protein [Kibdelosporangium philippinense]|uniref:Type II secretion system F family protein n=1 Tax=Kibdelosporangium philippinense TaxID=211113 RepID=A0ABS8ZNJ2_9PSEU|nr:type II secretion system F family protein [Kibdelosporangium philippinense]MCE7009299.1 type II secretion system F family protein [Kibdelosporangium philippinense]
MTIDSWALVVLAAALLVTPGIEVTRLRLAAMTRKSRRKPPGKHLAPAAAATTLAVIAVALGGWVIALPVAVAGWFVARRLLKPPPPRPDPLRLATSWDLLAACLRAGLPVPAAVGVIADRVPGDGGRALRTTAGLLALGADAADAWRPSVRVPETAPLARSARRTARSGTELATVVSALATEVRVSASDIAEARAQRAGVLMAGPLGLCFLPAFVCLGIVPVVAGLAGQLGLGR